MDLPIRPQKKIATESGFVRKVGRAALWQVLGGGGQTIIRLGASLFLARALDPSDFGLFGMAIIAQEFVSRLGALGVNTGIIAKQDVSENDINTCFWLMAATRFMMFLVCFLGAPFAAWVFSEPLLVPVLRVVSFTFVISILQVMSETLLNRELKFGTVNVIRGVSVLLESSLAVYLAFNGYGYWALVYALWLGTIFQGITIFIAARWLPKFCFCMSSFHYLFKFGIHGLGFSITNYLSQNLDYLLIGRVLGTGALGLYEFAYRIPHLVLERISQPVGQVIFPALSILQASDEQMANGYLKTIKFVCLITFPALAGLAVVADVAVPILWGVKWQAIIVPLQILCLSAALRCLPQPVGAIFYCKQRPDLPFKITLLTLIWTATAVGILGYYYGLVGVSVGMLISIFPSYISIFLAFKMTSTSLSKLFYAIRPIIICTVMCASSAFFVKKMILLTFEQDVVAFFVAVFVGIVVYLCAIIILFPRFFSEILDGIESVFGVSIKKYSLFLM